MTLEFTTAAAGTQVRSCQCGFCTRQGAATVSDPAGHAVIEMAADDARQYQFGTRTATSLICGTCGVYVGAIVQDGDKVWSIANTRGLAIAEFAGRTGEPMVYEHETPAQRIARRKQRWTPTELKVRLPA
ncbi:MAG: hypothetical protein ACKVP7_04850 [Hyphomicrobiaceae bacterium]